MTKEELQAYLAEGLSLEQIGRRVEKHPSVVAFHGFRPTATPDMRRAEMSIRSASEPL